MVWSSICIICSTVSLLLHLSSLPWDNMTVISVKLLNNTEHCRGFSFVLGHSISQTKFIVITFYFCSCLLLLLLKFVLIVALSFLLILFIFNLSWFVPGIFLWYSVGYSLLCPLSYNLRAHFDHRLSHSRQAVGWVKDKKELIWSYEQSLEEYMSSTLFPESLHSNYLEKIEGHELSPLSGSEKSSHLSCHKGWEKLKFYPHLAVMRWCPPWAVLEKLATIKDFFKQNKNGLNRI